MHYVPICLRNLSPRFAQIHATEIVRCSVSSVETARLLRAEQPVVIPDSYLIVRSTAKEGRG